MYKAVSGNFSRFNKFRMLAEMEKKEFLLYAPVRWS